MYDTGSLVSSRVGEGHVAPWRVRLAVAGSLVWLSMLGASSPAFAEAKPGIYVQVLGLRNSKGSVRCGLFAEKKNWLGTSPHRGARAKIQEGKATCVFRDVDPGVYAVSVLHDEDDDGEMDKSALGLPQEGYGASRGAVGESVGAPNWEDAKFRYDGKVERLKVSLRYR